MTLGQNNEKSGGVSEKTGSFMVWLRREKRRWLAGSMQRGKKRHFCSCYQVKSRLYCDSCCGRLLFQKSFENSISAHENGKPYTPGGRLEQRTSSFQKTFLLLLFFFFCRDIWLDPLQFAMNEFNTAPKMKTGKMCHDRERRVLFEKVDLFCVSFSLYRHRWVLFWSRLWPFLCQLCWQFPVPLS